MEYTNRAHSLFFLFLTSILIGLNYLGISLADTSVNILCLFLILTIGMSHGSLNNWKGNKILKIYKIKDGYIFYLIYILVALFVVALWLLLPSIALMLFLIVASYHFGKEDSFVERLNWAAGEGPPSVLKKSDNLQFFLKGSIIVLAPLMFHFEETLSIFETLLIDNINFFYSDNVRDFLSVLFLISFFAGLNLFIETVCIIALNYFFSPLAAFTVYFCFLHSIRHLASLVQDLEYEIDKNKVPKRVFEATINGRGAKILFRKILPLTLITAIIFILGVFLLTNYYNINDAILKVIFIGLASLTFPHILLEYLIEKNEERT